jgi:hypothetical protein
MSSHSVPNPVLPPAWAQVLETMEQSLEQAVATAPLQPTAPPPDTVAGREAAWQCSLERLHERLEQLRTCAAKAEENAAEMDALLSAGAADLERWLAGASATRQKLADWAARAV